jgi:hypothetical protein
MFSKLFFAFVFIFAATTSNLAFSVGGSPFEAKTDDLTVEDKCEVYAPAFFTAEPINYFTVGIAGTKRAGVSEEVAITRNEAKILWSALYPKSSEARIEKAMGTINNNLKLRTYFDLLEQGKIERGASYNSEGEILEILAYTILLESDSFLKMVAVHFNGQSFTEADFFVTGGVTYHDIKSGRTVGELDVVVGDSNTCTIFAIGEAKLGGKRSKARRQLDRIKSFIRNL